MLKRLLTGSIIVLVILGFFALRFVSTYFFDALIAFIAVMGTYEVCKVFEKNNKFNDKYFIMCYPLAILLTLILCVNFNVSELIYFAIIIGESLIFILSMYLYNFFTKKFNNKIMLESNYEGTEKTFIAKKLTLDITLLFYPAFILSTMFFLNHIADFGYFGGDSNVLVGMLFLLMLFVVTMFTDTGAYLIGSGLRGPKLCPKISPNKTISGAVGGLLSGIFGGLLVYFILNFIPSFADIFFANNISIWMFLIYGIVASVVTQIGDIFASYIKRKNNVKDYGNIFPGHGGVMDRMDGIAFNLIVTTIFAFIMFI